MILGGTRKVDWKSRQTPPRLMYTGFPRRRPHRQRGHFNAPANFDLVEKRFKMPSKWTCALFRPRYFGPKLAPAPPSRQLKAKALNALVAGKKAKEKAAPSAPTGPNATAPSRTPTTTTTTTNRINLLATKTTTTMTPPSASVVGGGPYAADITTDDYLVDWRHYRKGGRGAGGPSLEIGGQGGSHPLRGMDAVIQVRTLRARLRSTDRSRAAARRVG